MIQELKKCLDRGVKITLYKQKDGHIRLTWRVRVRSKLHIDSGYTMPSVWVQMDSLRIMLKDILDQIDEREDPTPTNR